MRISIKFLLLLTVSTSPAFGQGPLTPPSAPMPTMKTLSEIEPRTPIVGLPFTISTPGSYYLTSNATVTTSGINIRSSNVTLDLNGFTLTGDGGAVDYGVFVDPATRISGVTIRNGRLVNFAGLTAGLVDEMVIENMEIHTSSRTGIWISGPCTGAVIRNNLLVNCEYGLHITAFSGQQISGVTMANNRVTGGAGSGVLINPAAGGLVRDITIVNNQISGKSGTPIWISGSPGTLDKILIDSNHVTRTNSGQGILVSAEARATVIRNVLTGGTLNIGGSNNTVGPAITTIGPMGTAGADMSPWANFQN